MNRDNLLDFMVSVRERNVNVEEATDTIWELIRKAKDTSEANLTIPVVSGSLSFKAQKFNRRTLIGCAIANEQTKLGKHPESKGVSKLTDKIIDIVYGNNR